MRRVGGAEREIDEERLVGGQRLLRLHPGDGVVHQVRRQVILRVVRRLDRRWCLEEGRRPLVGLGADKAVEVLKTLAGRPAVERPRGAHLPHRRLVHLAVGGRAVAVQPQRLGDGGRAVGADGIVAGRSGGRLGDAAHADGVMVAPGEQRLARRRAERGGVEAVVRQALGRHPLQGGHVDRAAEGAGRAEAHVVDQDDDHVRRALRRAQRWRRLGLHILAVQGRGVWLRYVGDGQDFPSARPCGRFAGAASASPPAMPLSPAERRAGAASLTKSRRESFMGSSCLVEL